MKTLAPTLALASCLAVIASGAFAAETSTAADNTLSPGEKAAGWKLLFDGRSTAGWRGFKKPAPDAGWKVTDGTLHPDAKTSKDLITKDKFASFELAFDWKISPKGNSGVMFHVIEVGDETYESGPEYQILDNAHGEPPLQQAAGLFALYAPTKDMTKPVGQFNHGLIVVDHGKVQHLLNGVPVAAYEIGSPEFKSKVAASKFKRWPQFATAPAGFIALQNHGDDVWFKNIKIRVLP